MTWEYAKVTTFLGKGAGQIVIELPTVDTRGTARRTRSWVEGHGLTWQAFLDSELDDLVCQEWEFVDSKRVFLMPGSATHVKVVYRFRRTLPM